MWGIKYRCGAVLWFPRQVVMLSLMKEVFILIAHLIGHRSKAVTARRSSCRCRGITRDQTAVADYKACTPTRPDAYSLGTTGPWAVFPVRLDQTSHQNGRGLEDLHAFILPPCPCTVQIPSALHTENTRSSRAQRSVEGRYRGCCSNETQESEVWLPEDCT